MPKIDSVKIEFDTDNAAFEDDARPEISRILRELANKVDEADFFELISVHRIWDVNGNMIGHFEVDGDPHEEDGDEDDE